MLLVTSLQEIQMFGIRTQSQASNSKGWGFNKGIHMCSSQTSLEPPCEYLRMLFFNEIVTNPILYFPSKYCLLHWLSQVY